VSSKIKAFAVIITLVFIATSAGHLGYSIPENETEKGYACGGYYPFKEGFRWNYEFTISRGEESITYDLTVKNESTGTLSGKPTLRQNIKLKDPEAEGKVLAEYPRILWLREDKLAEIPQRNKEGRSSSKTILRCPPDPGISWSNQDVINFAFFEDNKSIDLQLEYKIEQGEEVLSVPAGDYRDTIQVVVHGEKTLERNQSRFTVTFDEYTWYGTETGLLKENLVKKVLGEDDGLRDHQLYVEKKELALESFVKT